MCCGEFAGKAAGFSGLTGDRNIRPPFLYYRRVRSAVWLLDAATPKQDEKNDNQKNNSNSATSTPLIVTVVATTSAEQKQENDE